MLEIAWKTQCLESTRPPVHKEAHIITQRDSDSNFNPKQIEELQRLLSSMSAKPSTEAFAANAGTGFSNTSIPWIVDSRATNHMIGSTSLLENYGENRLPASIRIADGSLNCVKGTGSVTLTNGLVLHNVLYVPKLTCNLLSISKLISDPNCNVVFGSGGCVFQEQELKKVIGNARLDKGLYILQDLASQTIALSTQLRNPTLGIHDVYFGTID